MSSAMKEAAHDFSPFLRIYKDGSVERFVGTNIVAPSVDPKTGVESKDVVISSETGVSARLFIPKVENLNKKLPLLVFFHGGGFYCETAFSPAYHNFVNMLVHEAKIVAVSVDYRRAPEHPLPIAYDDSWTALKWVASHVSGNGPDEWLNRLADLDKMYLAGDSAGGNIAHHMGFRYSQEKLDGVRVIGEILIQPFFSGSERIGSEAVEQRAFSERFWRLACPKTSGLDDPLINPVAAGHPNLASLELSRVLVCTSEKDILRDRVWLYYEKLKESGWGGVVEMLDYKRDGHAFYLLNPNSENSLAMHKQIDAFINV